MSPRDLDEFLIGPQSPRIRLVADMGWAVEQQGVSLIPLSLYFKDGYAKVELATGRGKKDYDKRPALAVPQATREAQRALSERHRR